MSEDVDPHSNLVSQATAELLPDFSSGESSPEEAEEAEDEDWESVTEEGWSIKSIDHKWMELRNDRLHRCFKVAKFQIGKAIKALNAESCFQALKPSACTCRNQCPSKFTYSEICAVRERLYTQESEQAKTTWLSQHLRDNNQKCTIAGKQVCVLFFCKALMISDYKVRLARKCSASPVNALSPVPRQPLRPDARTREEIAVR